MGNQLNVRLAAKISDERIALRYNLAGEPSDAEPEYGYIIPEERPAGSSSLVRTIKAFVEKPAPPLARQIISPGGLWNTMAMVFRPEILLNLAAVSQPNLHRSFHRIFDALGTSRESFVIEKSYRKMELVNFSKDLLEGFDLHSRNQLSVVPMKGVFWSDWGSEDRVLTVIGEIDHFRGQNLYSQVDLEKGERLVFFASPVAFTPRYRLFNRTLI